jgi:fatty-acyl-CoA synthase
MELKNITITQQFEKTVLDNSQRVVMTYKDTSYTWTEIDELADKMAIMILDLKINKGDKVAIWSSNSPFWIIAYLAISKIGAISVLINHKYKENEIGYILDYSDTKYVCYGDNYSEVEMQEIIKGINVKCIGLNKEFIPIGENDICRLKETPSISDEDYQRLRMVKEQITPQDIATMLFTSGTTSKPKGVMLTHFQLVNVAYEMVYAMHWTKDEQVCMSLPLFHCFGLMVGILSAQIHGGTVHFPDSYHSIDVMACIEKNKCNVLNGVPSMFLAILQNKHRKEYNLTSLDSGIIAGSGVHKSDFNKVVKELGMNHLMQSYGQTEASPSITFSVYEDPLELRASSVGKKIHNMDLRIVNPKTKEVNGPFIEGEIEIFGYNVMQGYYNNEVDTKKAFREDGWLRTGDLGYLDAEGNLYIVGRMKDVIIRCGENISPKEIEEVILEDSRVTQVKVFGIPMPVVQEEVVLCVESEVVFEDEDIFRKILKPIMADYKIPKYTMIYQDFPKLSNGKIDINKLKQDALTKIKEEVK